MAVVGAPRTASEERESTTSFYAAMLIGFNNLWWGSLPVADRPDFGHTALPNFIVDIERMRKHMLAERHAWDDGRAVLREVFEELKERVKPPRPSVETDPAYVNAAYDRVVWLFPTMDGKSICCCDTLLSHCLRRCLPARLACPAWS